MSPSNEIDLFYSVTKFNFSALRSHSWAEYSPVLENPKMYDDLFWLSAGWIYLVHVSSISDKSQIDLPARSRQVPHFLRFEKEDFGILDKSWLESCWSLLMWNNLYFIVSRHAGNISATIVLLFTAGLHDQVCPSCNLIQGFPDKSSIKENVKVQYTGFEIKSTLLTIFC